MGVPASADYSSIDSRTFSSVQQSTVGSSSAVSSPTNVIYNPQNYKPDPELNTKVKYHATNNEDIKQGMGAAIMRYHTQFYLN